jgi:hypothetical protein
VPVALFRRLQSKAMANDRSFNQVAIDTLDEHLPR